MAGPSLVERRGLTPKEPPLEEKLRRAAVLEINDAVASRQGIYSEERDRLFVGRDGFLFDGTQGPDFTRVTFPGISEAGKRFIIRTFYSGKSFRDPSFEVVYPAEYKNPGVSTQSALDEARKLLTPSQPANPALTP